MNAVSLNDINQGLWQSVILPLHPVSLTHKNPQKRKIIHGMRPVAHKDRSINHEH